MVSTGREKVHTGIIVLVWYRASTGMYRYLRIGTVPGVNRYVPVSMYWYGTGRQQIRTGIYVLVRYQASTGTYLYLRIGKVPGVNRYLRTRL